MTLVWKLDRLSKCYRMCYHSPVRVVIDTSVLVSAILGGRGGASREVVRRCLLGDYRPVIGTTLFLEYEDVLHRPSIIESSYLSESEIDELFDAFLSMCSWTTVYYRWRPNLVDEGDQHLLELAIAAGAQVIVTKNIRHLESGELNFPEIKIFRPEDLLKEP